MDKSVGNDNLISTEEGKIAELLKKRNLQKVNLATISDLNTYQNMGNGFLIC